MRSIIISLLLVCATTTTAQRQTLNFNGNWQLNYPKEAVLHPGEQRTVTLPRAWNEDWAYRVNIAQLPDDTCRYVKRFKAPAEWTGKHVFIEFEGHARAPRCGSMVIGWACTKTGSWRSASNSHPTSCQERRTVWRCSPTTTGHTRRRILTER